MKMIAFFDLETDSKNHILDIGCVKNDDAEFHSGSVHAFMDFVKDVNFLCGHNIHNHDLKQLHKFLGNSSFGASNAIDTLYLSPLLFPSRPYHRLVKDDKLHQDESNNPLNDSYKARDLFYDEVAAFQRLDEPLKKIYYGLLYYHSAFPAFFAYLNYRDDALKSDLGHLIGNYFHGAILQPC